MSSYWLEINLCLICILDNQGLPIVLVDSSIKWTVLAHFLTPNFTPKILTHKILMPNTHA